MVLHEPLTHRRVSARLPLPWLALQSHYDGDPTGHGFSEPRPSPYADGLFRVQIKLERDYPITPPKVRRA